MQKVEGVLNEDTSLKRLPKIEKEMNDLRKRKEKLLDLRLDTTIDRDIYESKIIGGYNKEGVEEPLKITFVYKTGIHSNFNGKDFKPKRRNAAALHSDAELCSYASDEAAELCSHSSNDTYREYGVDTKGQYLKILEFKRFVKHFSFKKISETYSQKELLEEITVVVALDVVERDTRNPSFINESKSSDR